MKVNKNGIASDIEESDVVDGVLIIPEGVKKIDWGKISKIYPPIKFAKFIKMPLMINGKKINIVSIKEVEDGIVYENIYEKTIKWFENLREPYTDENNLVEGKVEPQELIKLKRDYLKWYYMMKDENGYHNLLAIQDITYEINVRLNEYRNAPERVRETKNKIEKLAQELQEAGNKGRAISSIKSISFPNTIVSIGKEAFSELSNLSEVVMPDSITELGTSAFSRLFKIRTCSIVKKIRNNSL